MRGGNRIWAKTLLLGFFLTAFLLVRGQDKPTGQNTLTAKQRSIIPIAAFTAKGNQVRLKGALEEGLAAGLTVNETKEILVHLYAYTGFPRSLNAISTLQGLLTERKQKGISDPVGRQPSAQTFPRGKFAFGKDVQTQLTGSTATGSAQTFVPIIDTFLKEHLFADIFSRNNLDYQSREIATIAALASLGGAEGQLGGHLNVGRHVGLTEPQLREIAGTLWAAIDADAGRAATKILDGMFGGGQVSGQPASTVAAGTEPTFAKGEKVTNGNFSGEVWVSMLTSVDAATSTSVGNVTFAPKARSNWHRHPSGQILLVTDGVGYYQEKGQPIRVIRKGDVIKCPPDLPHWHGASRDSSMSHVALGPSNGKGAVVWLDKVSDEEYNKQY
ncbi:carboxymuconolactone decarboxylase family protein [Mucilaginibacter lacusdianchii]|uniref:carboxymuconolactone decarboxylase family protein n=1 Tax=Mucilaginibacter lacusdianchii TaxID=2684211 RepID=UPI00131D2312|nr:carboxymuconolactone decarboxylase family protein [Mucilaginibacter sp. JXJ CY 39]